MIVLSVRPCSCAESVLSDILKLAVPAEQFAQVFL